MESKEGMVKPSNEQGMFADFLEISFDKFNIFRSKSGERVLKK